MLTGTEAIAYPSLGHTATTTTAIPPSETLFHHSLPLLIPSHALCNLSQATSKFHLQPEITLRKPSSFKATSSSLKSRPQGPRPSLDRAPPTASIGDHALTRSPRTAELLAFTRCRNPQICYSNHAVSHKATPIKELTTIKIDPKALALFLCSLVPS